MGGLISRLRALFTSRSPMRVLMNGLDAAGKTTILYKLKLGEVVTTIPTIGFNVETVEYKQVSFTVWDVGGRDKIRPLWRHYYTNTNAIVWVIDSNDHERLGGGKRDDDYNTARSELHKALSEEELADIPVLIFANKQDLPNALSTKEIAERLGLHALRNRAWLIQGCCATNGDGLYEGLDWLSNAVKQVRSKVTPPPAAASSAVRINSISWQTPAPNPAASEPTPQPAVQQPNSSLMAATVGPTSLNQEPATEVAAPVPQPSSPAHSLVPDAPPLKTVSPSHSPHLPAPPPIMRESDFVLVESRTRSKSQSGDEDEGAWLDVQGEVTFEPPTHTARMVSLRMIEAI